MDIDEVCKLLHQNYDANILNLASLSVRALFIYYALQNQNTKKGNRTLIKLICNYAHPKPFYRKFLGGPETLSLQHDPTSGMNVYIFGEFHGQDNSCPAEQSSDIVDFFDNLFTNTSAFIDFYAEIDKPDEGKYLELEYSWGKKPSWNTKQKLFRMTKQFENCLSYHTRKDTDKCQLVRTHWTDIRFPEGGRGTYNPRVINYHAKQKGNGMGLLIEKIKKTKIDPFSKFMICLDVLRINSHSMEFRTFISKYKPFNDFLKKLADITQYEGTLVNSWEKGMDIDKEISKSTQYDEIKTLLMPVIRKEFKRVSKSLAPTDAEQLSKVKIGDPKVLPNYIAQQATFLFDGLIIMNSFTMDFYLLCRLFRNFNVKSTDQQPSKPRNVIIYAGDAHSQRYRSVLRSMGFKMERFTTANEEEIISKSHNGVIPKGCLSLENFPSPLF